MFRVEKGDFPYYQFGHLAECPGILHFVSSGIKDIGFSEDADPGIIRENRKALAISAGFDPDRWVTGYQVHSANVAVVTCADAGRGGMDRESRLPDTDALVTDQEGICLMVLSADCVPILLYDPECRVIAAIHAGWRGTAARIAVRAVEVMRDRFGCKVGNILAGIGPSIGKCCFEVGEEVAEVFRGLYPETVECENDTTAKCLVDLWEVNRLVLLEAGLQAEHIEVAGMCTVCHPDRFFSYRRDGKQAGRFGAGIQMKAKG